MNIKAIGSKALVELKKASPEILVGVGIICVIGGTVMACRATRKVDQIMADHEAALETVNMAKDEYDEETYSEKDYQKDLIITYAQTGLAFAKVYGPAIAVELVGIICILSSHVILKNRNVALVAAFNALNAEFRDYRNAVVEELGEEKDRYFRGKRKSDELASTDGAPEETNESRKHPSAGRYTRYFDETAREWRKNADYNKAFLVCQQSAANNRLKAKGMLFLNEVYEMLGFDPTPEGAVVGWVYRRGEDNFVDFGIYKDDNEGNRLFVNCMERSILLDFNVQGIVFDML